MLPSHKQTIAIFVLKDCRLAKSIIIVISDHMLMKYMHLIWLRRRRIPKTSSDLGLFPFLLHKRIPDEAMKASAHHPHL